MIQISSTLGPMTGTIQEIIGGEKEGERKRGFDGMITTSRDVKESQRKDGEEGGREETTDDIPFLQDHRNPTGAEG